MVSHTNMYVLKIDKLLWYVICKPGTGLKINKGISYEVENRSRHYKTG
jgi:hypothetical protein